MKINPDQVSIDGKEVKGIESLDITEGSVDDVVREFKDPSAKPLNIRVKGTSARGMMGACFAKILEEEQGTESIDVMTWSKLARLKQLIVIVFCPWKVWALHNKIQVQEETIEDLLADIDQAIEQRDQVKSVARKLMMKKEA